MYIYIYIDIYFVDVFVHNAFMDFNIIQKLLVYIQMSDNIDNTSFYSRH